MQVFAVADSPSGGDPIGFLMGEPDMLVLSRKSGQTIVLPELDVELTVLDLRGDQVWIGISTPSDVRIHREEVWQHIQHGEPGASATGGKNSGR